MGILEKLRQQQKERQFNNDIKDAEKEFKANVKHVRAIRNERGFMVLMKYWEDKYNSLDSYLKSNSLTKEEVYKANFEKNMIGNYMAFVAMLLEHKEK